MAHRVVLEADWFVIDKVRHFKRIAFFAPSLGRFREFTFSLPPGVAIYRADLISQSRHSHKLDWREKGEFRHDEIYKALSRMIDLLGEEELDFYAKGSEKCKLFEKYLGRVVDLDSTGCPRYEDLSRYPKTTLQKAIAFGQWLEWSE